MYVYLIYCDDCVDCKNMERIVLDHLKKMGVEYELEKFNCEDDSAFDVAIKYGVNDVPACIFLNDGKTKFKSHSGPASCQEEDVEWAVNYVNSK